MTAIETEAGAVPGAPARADQKRSRLRWLVVAVPYAWLLLMFLAPFLIVLKISFSTTAIAMPPYFPVFDFSEGLGGLWEAAQEFSLDSYRFIFSPEAAIPQGINSIGAFITGWVGFVMSYNLYVGSYLTSLKIALVSTFLILIVAYPIAYGMARAKKEWQPALVMMVILPFWTSFLIRVYAWIGILKQEGLLNQLLLSLGIIDKPLTIMATDTAVYIGIVYSYLPFMILPLYAALEKLDGTLLEAAADLGCPPIQAFWKITFPLSLPGVIAGCFLVFIPATGEFVIPDLLGGSSTNMIGRTLWNEFFNNRDWPVASAVAVLLLLILVVPIVYFQNQQQKQAEKAR